MNPAVLQYRKELLAICPKGHKAKQILLSEFQQSISPFLEDVSSPTYEELVDAIGTPSHIVQTLVDSVDLPPPMSRKRKFTIVSILCCAVLCVGILSFCLWNAPEHNISFPDTSFYSEETLWNNYVFATDEEFSDHDVIWGQPRPYNTYLILFHNTNQLSTRITISYSKYQDPHVFDVPAETSIACLVQDAHFGEHTLSFSTSDGSLSGTVQVLIQK